VKGPYSCLWVDTAQQLSRWLSFWLSSGRHSVQNSVGASGCWPISWVFFRFFQARSGLVSLIRQRRPPSSFFPVHYSLVVPNNRATDVSLRNEQIMTISVYRKTQKFLAFSNAQQCYMFRSVRPSSWINVHSLEQVKWVKNTLEFSRSCRF